MHLVDTHVHIWDLKQFPYSWCAGIPLLNRTFLLDDYVPAACDTGIAKAIFMECDVDDPHALAEAQHAQLLAEKNPLIAGIVASGRPEHDGFRAYLGQLARLPKVRGLRRVLHTQPDELSQQPRFAQNLRMLSEFGFTFDLCVLARQLPVAIKLAEKCPRVLFVLDHCGVPNVRTREVTPWLEHIARLAELPNVVCKISGLGSNADANTWSVDDLWPWVAHVFDRFGWDRVVWGGDWPVCTLSATLAEWVRATRELTRNATDEQRAKLFYRNAERIYRIDSQSRLTELQV